MSSTSADLLDTLIKSGSDVLPPDQAAVVQEAAKALGEADLDVTKPANILLSQLRPMLVDQIGKMAAVFEAAALNSVEGLDAAYSKETMLTIYPSLQKVQKLLIWLLVFAALVGCGYVLFDVVSKPPYDIVDVVIIALSPIFVLLVVVSVPIKTLAYTSLQIGAKVIEAKAKKSEAAK